MTSKGPLKTIKLNIRNTNTKKAEVITNLTLNDCYPHISDVLLEYLIKKKTTQIVPQEMRLDAFVIFADIRYNRIVINSGFSTLAESLAKNEKTMKIAAEKLSEYMEQSLDILIRKIYDSGGDVIKFAGDAVLAIFPVIRYNTVEECIYVGLHTTLNLLSPLKVEDVTLFVHVGCGFGSISCFLIGGVDDRWEFFISGEPLSQISGAEHEAEKGECVVSPKVYDLIKPYVEKFQIKPKGNYHIEQIKTLLYTTMTRENRLKLLIPSQYEPLAINIIKKFIDKPCLKNIESGMSELRQITTLFINLKNLVFTLSNVQKVITEIQSQLKKLEGILCRFSVDDKGTVILCAFGLPPYQHVNDPIRAIVFSLDLQKSMKALKIDSSIGISYGQAFCGRVGGSTRCEYTVHGTRVNLAARCMVVGRQTDSIYVDENVYNETNHNIRYSKKEYHQLKGYDNEVPLYIPTEVIIDFDSPVEKIELVGRDAEVYNLLNSIVDYMYNSKSRSVYLIDGERGVGKHSLVRKFLQIIPADAPYIVFHNYAYDVVTTPFSLFQNFFNKIFLPEKYSDNLVERIQQFLKPSDKGRVWLFKKHFYPDLGVEEDLQDPIQFQPILYNLIFEIIDSITNQLSMHKRLNSLLELPHYNQEEITRVFFIFEEIHLADRSSLQLLHKCIRNLSHCFFLLTSVTSKPMDNIQMQSIKLLNLYKDDVLTLLQNKLEVNDIDDDFLDLVWNQCKGNPYYIDEFLKMLKSKKWLSVEEGQLVILYQDITDLPDGINTIFINQLDGLDSKLQLILRIGSVLVAFKPDSIIKIIYNFNQKLSDAEIQQSINDLCHQKILIKQMNNDYVFKSTQFREAVYFFPLLFRYNNMNQKLKIKFHMEIAIFLERNSVTQSNLFKLISYHYQQAEAYNQSYYYLIHAADEEFSYYNFEEALTLYQSALKLFQKYDFKLGLYEPEDDQFSSVISPSQPQAILIPNLTGGGSSPKFRNTCSIGLKSSYPLMMLETKSVDPISHSNHIFSPNAKNINSENLNLAYNSASSIKHNEQLKEMTKANSALLMTVKGKTCRSPSPNDTKRVDYPAINLSPVDLVNDDVFKKIDLEKNQILPIEENIEKKLVVVTKEESKIGNIVLTKSLNEMKSSSPKGESYGTNLSPSIRNRLLANKKHSPKSKKPKDKKTSPASSLVFNKYTPNEMNVDMLNAVSSEVNNEMYNTISNLFGEKNSDLLKSQLTISYLNNENEILLEEKKNSFQKESKNSSKEESKHSLHEESKSSFKESGQYNTKKSSLLKDTKLNKESLSTKLIDINSVASTHHSESTEKISVNANFDTMTFNCDTDHNTVVNNVDAMTFNCDTNHNTASFTIGNTQENTANNTQENTANNTQENTNNYTSPTTETNTMDYSNYAVDHDFGSYSPISNKNIKIIPFRSNPSIYPSPGVKMTMPTKYREDDDKRVSFRSQQNIDRLSQKLKKKFNKNKRDENTMETTPPSQISPRSQASGVIGIVPQCVVDSASPNPTPIDNEMNDYSSNATYSNVYNSPLAKMKNENIKEEIGLEVNTEFCEIYLKSVLYNKLGMVYFSCFDLINSTYYYQNVLSTFEFFIPQLEDKLLKYHKWRLKSSKALPFPKVFQSLIPRLNHDERRSIILLISSIYLNLSESYLYKNIHASTICLYSSFRIALYYKDSTEYINAFLRMSNHLVQSKITKNDAIHNLSNMQSLINGLGPEKNKVMLDYYYHSSLINFKLMKISESRSFIEKAEWLSTHFQTMNIGLKINIKVLRLLLNFLQGKEIRLNSIETQNKQIVPTLRMVSLILDSYMGNIDSIMEFLLDIDPHLDLSDLSGAETLFSIVFSSFPSFVLHVSVFMSLLHLQNQKYSLAFFYLKTIMRTKILPIKKFVFDIFFYYEVFYIWWKCTTKCFLQDAFYEKDCKSLACLLIKNLNEYCDSYDVYTPFLLIFTAIYYRIFNQRAKGKQKLDEYFSYQEKYFKTNPIPLLDALYSCELIYYDRENKENLVKVALKYHEKTKAGHILEYVTVAAGEDDI